MDADALADLLAESCARQRVPGAQLGLLRGDVRTVVCAGNVSLDGAPVHLETPFHAGSLAKSLTALVVVDAARRGELDLDVPCDQQASGTWSDTPRSLMAQTTGRPNLLPELDEPLDAFVARVAAVPRVHAPGRFSYSNANWPVLDVLLRQCSNASFEELARERVLGPRATFGMPASGANGYGVTAEGALTPVPAAYATAASAAGSRWWATADQLLDYASLHLGDGADRFDPADVRELRRPHAAVPGATMADAWGLGWALWERGSHRAFGWAGYTGGHRAYLRCFPQQDAALVLLTSCAGPLFGPPGGSALFDVLLPDLLQLLEVPELPPAPHQGVGSPAAELAGSYGPVRLEADGRDELLVHAAGFGEADPLRHERAGDDVFVRAGAPPGGMLLTVDDGLLYLGPFAIPRS